MRRPKIQHRLRSERHRLFVGRQTEIETFVKLLDTDPLAAHVVYVHGPGGIGKTALLCEFQREGQLRGPHCVWLDCRPFAQQPEAADALLAQALGADPSASPWPIVEHAAGRWILLMDNFEPGAASEQWLRNELLPRLSAECLVVIASRVPPSHAWRMEGGWGSLFRSLQLGELSLHDAEALMERRGTPVAARESIYDFTGGHPLGLTLLAEQVVSQGIQRLEQMAMAAVTGPLLETLVGDLDGSGVDGRTALQLAAILRRTTEDAVTEVLGDPDTAARTFEWLRSRSFMQHDLDGIYPVKIVRSLVLADLRWRSPESHASLRRHVRQYLVHRLRATEVADARRFILEYLHLCHDRLHLARILEWPLSRHLSLEKAQPNDRRHIVDMVRRYEGDSAAMIAGALFDTQPEAFLVVRQDDPSPVAFLAAIRLDWHHGPPDVGDPGLEAVWRYLSKEAPLRTNERAVVFRFWMASGAYQRPSPLTGLLVLEMYRLVLLARNLAFHVTIRSDAANWRPILDHLGGERLPNVDFTLEGKSYEATGHDWRRMPVAAWLEKLAEHEPWLPAHPSLEDPAQEAAVLDQATFKSAVREALRQLSTPADLVDNPLIHSRLVVSESGTEAAVELRAQALERLLLESVDELRTSPKLTRYYRALHRAYLNPAETQELAADSLGISYSTFRRHLSEAVDRVAVGLWRREIKGGDRAPHA